MGQHQSKEELVYQQVNNANIERIKALCQEGAGLEWINKEGKTPLIVACLNPQLYHVAKALIELGANVNAYRPGSHAGTPLHHATKKGLHQTVELLLSHGANALVMNDDCQTALDLARLKGYSNVVRTIESHLCIFCGLMRELHGPGFLEVLAPKWISKKIWVVVLPCTSRNSARSLKLELSIYTSPQDAQPRSVIALCKVKIEQPKLHKPDPTLVIYDNATKTRYKFASANEGDKQQLQQFYNACGGIPQAMQSLPPLVPATAPPCPVEDVELAMAINASIHSAMEERPPPFPNNHQNASDWENFANDSSYSGPGTVGETAIPSKSSISGLLDERPAKDSVNGWSVPEAGSSSQTTQQDIPAAAPDTQVIASDPSGPPIPEGSDDGPVCYPSIDSSPVDIPMLTTEGTTRTNEMKEDGGACSSCVICLDAPVEGACIPCGHMAGCMSCLNEIKVKKWGCPVCRANIQQILRLYSV